MIIILLIVGVLLLLLAPNPWTTNKRSTNKKFRDKGASGVLGSVARHLPADPVGALVVAFLPDRTPVPATRRRTKSKTKVSAEAKTKRQPVAVRRRRAAIQ